MESAFSFIAPVAIIYSINAFRKLPERIPARFGLGFAILVLLLFGLQMTALVTHIARYFADFVWPELWTPLK